MRGGLLRRNHWIGLAAILIMGVLALPVLAQENAVVTQFPPQTATITLTNSGMTITPSSLNPGAVTFTIVNNSDRARGIYVTGLDRAGTPIIRYSPRIMPGASTTMEFWLYQGNSYSFHDFTSRSISHGRSMFATTYSTDVNIPILAPIGRGPQYTRESGTITITNSGIEVSPQSNNHGPITYTVYNRTNRPRGVVITGTDRADSPIIRYTRMIPPGSSTHMQFWLYEGKTYTVKDFTSRFAENGEMRFNSHFTTTVSVEPGSPAGFGTGPGMNEENNEMQNQ